MRYRWDRDTRPAATGACCASCHANKNASLFDFKGHQVRVVDRDGAPWFVAKDVCEALGFNRNAKGYVNVTDALRGVSPDEKNSVRIGINRGRGLAAVAESGLYKLVMRSDKPSAKAFQDWVTRTVLPAIRKDGGYIAGEEFVATGSITRACSCESRRGGELLSHMNCLLTEWPIVSQCSLTRFIHGGTFV